MPFILTAQADAFPLALAEAGRPRVLRQLEPGVALCEGAARPNAPVFLRHMCPAEVSAPLSGGQRDIKALSAALPPLLSRVRPGETFSVQSRVMEGYHPQYKRFDVNTALSSIVLETGAVLDVKAPRQILSVTLTEGMGYLGLSTARENLSDWAGGARRFKWEPGQISRAEFKLLEALEQFGITLADGQRALDLGAAPGGWTRILRRHGLYVTAVDPAALDARLQKDKRVTHYRGTAQAYFQSPGQFDLMVNDMKMDAVESAAVMVTGAHCLPAGGTALLTLKLPEDIRTWEARLTEASILLEKAYEIRHLRQLFHNRHEVTAHLVKL